MPKGGARVRSGPPPDPNALHRGDDDGEWTSLPAAGRKGRVPAWPLPDQSPRERKVWTDLWHRPQAVQWERCSQQYEVALYVRRFVEAEERESSVSLSTLVRQMADGLGLTTPGMRSNRWRIVAEQAEPERTESRPSARDRLTIVPNAG